MANHRSLALAAFLLLAIWGIWLHGIGLFPPFVDETVHIHMAELNRQNSSILEGINLGRQFTIWWYGLFQPAASSPLWVARTATVLAFLPGIASVAAIARLAAGWWSATFAALLILFSTYHLFFARLALADTVSAGLVLAAIYFASRLRFRASDRDALLVGVLLFMAIGAKVNNLPFVGVPVAAVVALRPEGRSWRMQVRWLVMAIGSAGGLLAVFMLGLRLRGFDFLGNSLSLAVSGRGDLDLGQLFSLSRIGGNMRDALEVFGVYLGIPALILLLLALPALFFIGRQRSTGIYLILCLLGPALILWINQPQETRFYVVPLALLLLCGAVAFASLVQRQSPIIYSAALTLILFWGLTQWLPFASTAVTEPEALPLPDRDYAQYVISDASGFGFAEVAQALERSKVNRIIGLLANCQGLRYTLRGYPVECPPMRPNGQDRAALLELMSSSGADGVYVVLEAIPYAPASAPGTEIAIIDYPPGKPRLTIFDLSPQP